MKSLGVVVFNQDRFKVDQLPNRMLRIGCQLQRRHRISYRSSRSAHARDRKAGPRESKVEGDGNRVVVAIDINNPYFFISINI